MKIMNISSLLRTLLKFLALLVALACTLPLIHAKVGEQENWYLEKQIYLNGRVDQIHTEFPEGFSDNIGSIYSLKYAPNDGHYAWDSDGGWNSSYMDHKQQKLIRRTLDSNSTPQLIYAFLDESEFYIKHFTILSSGEFLVLGLKGSGARGTQVYETGLDQSYQEMTELPYILAIGRPILDGMITGFSVDVGSYGSTSDSGHISTPPTFLYEGGVIHPENTSVYTQPLVSFSIYDSITYHLDNPGPRYSEPPTVKIDFETWKSEHEANHPDFIHENSPFEAVPILGGALLLSEVYELNSTSIENYSSENPSHSKFHINSSNKIVIHTGETDEAHNFEILQLNQATDSNETTVSLLNELSIAKGSAPGQTNGFSKYLIHQDDQFVIKENNGHLKFFSFDGRFLKKSENQSTSLYPEDINEVGKILCSWSSKIHILDQFGEIETTVYPDGNSWDARWLSLKWTNDGGFGGLFKKGDEAGGNEVYSFQIWKRAYRTKGLQNKNIIPQPVVRSVTQRPGTNILDIDFEIIDPDDDTATAGILGTIAIEDAYQDGFYGFEPPEFNDLSKLIVPSSLTDGTDSLLGQPITTNGVHRVSWYVKGDGANLPEI